MTQSGVEKLVGILSPEAREFLRASTSGGMSTKIALTKEQIASNMVESLKGGLQSAIIELMRSKPALISRSGQGASYTFTREGAMAAHHLVMPTGEASEPDAEIVLAGPKKLHRGSNNGAMRAHARAVGGEFCIDDGKRCDSCGHTNSRFIRRGSRVLCQDCFARGVRF